MDTGDPHQIHRVEGGWQCACGVVLSRERASLEALHARAAGARDTRRYVVRALGEMLEEKPDYLEFDLVEEIRRLISDLKGNRIAI